MTGPEHYREAEQLLGAIQPHWLGSNETSAAIEMAQAHATLALAAATAFGAAHGPLRRRNRDRAPVARVTTNPTRQNGGDDQ